MIALTADYALHQRLIGECHNHDLAVNLYNTVLHLMKCYSQRIRYVGLTCIYTVQHSHEVLMRWLFWVLRLTSLHIFRRIYADKNPS